MSPREQIESASTKDELVAIGRDLYSAELDRRKTMKDLKDELLDLEPGIGPEPRNAPAPAKAEYTGRLLRHRGNGRLFPWTAQLAKSRVTEEV